MEIVYLTLKTDMSPKFESKIQKVFQTFPEAKYAIVNSVSKQQRKHIFPGYAKACFMENVYDTCIVLNPRKTSSSEKMSIKLLHNGFNQFPVRPKIINVENRFVFVVFTISKKETSKISPSLKYIRNVLQKVKERTGVDEENVFAIGDFGADAKTLLRTTKLNAYMKSPNRIEGTRMFWVSNIVGFAPLTYVKAEPDYDFPKAIYGKKGNVYLQYGKDISFLPIKITVPAKE